jgi:hypothetical protein
MAGDRARVSYDPSRQWRGLIAQQGRVTVEADWNEAATIDRERDRLATLDAVGPVGTPDHGYSVTAVPAGTVSPAGTAPPGVPGDLIIGHGTLYLGGERLDLGAPVTYSKQPDWLDHSTDTLYTAPAVPAGNASELVYLLAFEQEVSAVEDPALADVALGGPDTMQRQRILQHFVRQPTQASTCSDAWSAFTSSLGARGLQFDAASMMIESTTMLQVTFTTTVSAPGPCQPVATGGYLGAENQMIRVMVTRAETPTIVWGFDDASFLYRVQSATYDSSSGNTTITLVSAPVDSYHAPAAGQAVELLRDAVQLTDADYIASATGFVSSLTGSYNSDLKQVVISGQPPTDYLSAATQQLYLRVWQSTAAAPLGEAIELSGTGVAVTLASSTGNLHVGDFWRFALRPIQPAIVYPERYLDAAQSPDGPRTWACPLAVLSWLNGKATATTCVPPFSNLVELTDAKAGCCTVAIGPSDVSGGASLQTLLAGYADQGPITVCLDPGTYTVSEPLVLGTSLNDLTLQACGQGVVLCGPSDPGPAFTLGLIVVQGAGPVTIRGIELSVPLVGFSPPATSFEGLPQQNQPLLATFSAGLQVAIGIFANDAASLTVADCTFAFPDPGQANVFGAGIYATGTMDGVAVTGCIFQSANPPETAPFYDLTAGNQTEPPYQLTFGYLQEAIFPQGDTSASDAAGQLQDGVIERCLFQGITVAVFAMTQIGTLRIDQNTVRNCYGGFWLYSINDPFYLTLLDGLAIGDPTTFQRLGTLGEAALCDRLVPIATAIGRVLPATPPVSGKVVTGTILAPSTVQLTRARQMLSTLFTPAAGPGGTPGTTAPAAAGEATQKAEPTEAAQTEAAPAEAPLAEAAIADLPSAIDINFQLGGSGPLPPVIPVADTGTSVSLRLDLCDCQVDAVIAESYSGAALLLADLTISGLASALIHGNRLRSRFPVGEAAAGFALAEAAINGNIVANEVAIATQPGPTFPIGYSLTLAATSTPLGAPAVAVAGNVFIDPPIIPGRTDVLNTVVDYSAVPTVTGVSPTSGLTDTGTTVTITGTGFTAATEVIFGPTTLTNQTNVSDTEIKVTSPTASSPGTVDIQVVTPAGTSTTSTADQFSYTSPHGIVVAEARPAPAAETSSAPPTQPNPVLPPATESPHPEPPAS